jgi:hypothetical protein
MTSRTTASAGPAARLLRRALATGCLAGMATLGTGVLAAPALAAAQQNSATASPDHPVPGGTVSLGATAACTKTLGCSSLDGGYQPVQVVLTSPQGCRYPVGSTSASNGTWSDTFDSSDDLLGGAALPAPSGSCGQPEVSGDTASGGTWVLSLPGTAASASFLVTPPAPAGVNAAPDAGGVSVTLSWSPVSTPDLAGYTVLDQDPGATAAPRTYTAAEAGCASGANCAVTISYPAAGAAGSHRLAVQTDDRASAAAAPQSSAPSAPATFTLTGPPPRPSPSGSAAGSSPAVRGPGSARPGSGRTGSGSLATGAGTGQNASAAQAAAQRAVALSFSSFAPLSGIAGLPPLPQLAGPAAGSAADNPQVAGGEPSAPGTYSPTLGYPAQTATDRVVSAAGASGILPSFSAAVSPAQLWRSVAVALLLGLAAAHLRLWLRRHQREEY